jgi:hypothetical protein
VTAVCRLLASVLVAMLLMPVAAAAQWSPFGAEADAVCADGSAVNYLERAADPTKVVLYFEGGGGCFSAETCAFDGPEKRYTSQSAVTPESLADRPGMFDFDDARNPMSEHSFVYVPYCTGDVHLGDQATSYGDDLVVEHRGYPNGLVALDHLVESYPEAEQVVVTGSSAGSVPTPLYAGLVQDALPEADVVSIGDSSGAYPGDPTLTAIIGNLWGSMAALPDWPEVEGMTIREWTIPGLYNVVAEHAPAVTLAKFDYAYDEAQAFNGSLVGVDADDLLELIDEIGLGMEADGAEVVSYIAPGPGHTILGSDAFYTLEVEGVRFIDWVSDLIDGNTPPDVHCVACR